MNRKRNSRFIGAVVALSLMAVLSPAASAGSIDSSVMTFRGAAFFGDSWSGGTCWWGGGHMFLLAGTGTCYRLEAPHPFGGQEECAYVGFMGGAPVAGLCEITLQGPLSGGCAASTSFGGNGTLTTRPNGAIIEPNLNVDLRNVSWVSAGSVVLGQANWDRDDGKGGRMVLLLLQALGQNAAGTALGLACLVVPAERFDVHGVGVLLPPIP